LDFIYVEMISLDANRHYLYSKSVMKGDPYKSLKITMPGALKVPGIYAHIPGLLSGMLSVPHQRYGIR
jgi:hypothetical protein